MVEHVQKKFENPWSTHKRTWASEGFIPGGDNSGLLQVVAKSIFQGGQTTVKFLLQTLN